MRLDTELTARKLFSLHSYSEYIIAQDARK